MNGRIELKDGFCVSCGLESGVIYRSCPYCDEMVWHPFWRQLLFWYVAVVLPLFSFTLLVVNRDILFKMMESLADSSWKLQIAVMLPASALLLPYENRRLVYTSVKSYTLWLLNALAASVIILLCALLFALELCFSESVAGVRFTICMVALSSLSVPLVLNCDWRRLIAAALFAAAMMCV